MKHPLIALPLSTLLVLTGCGGSSSGGDDAPPPPPPPSATLPTVTVTAPATGVTTIAFDVAWTSTNATSCSSEFSDKTTASGSESVTATEAGTATYSVTCTGAGGTATGQAAVEITAIGTAQGLWEGDSTGNGGSRTFAGVVTDDSQFWLVYNGVNAQAGDPAGFFTGVGSTVNDSATSGTFGSTGMVEFNFEGDGSSVGTLETSFVDKTSLNGTAVSSFGGTQTYTIDGVTDDPLSGGLGATLVTNPDPVTFNDAGTPWVVVPNAGDPAGTPSITGALNFPTYTIDLSIPLNPADPSEVHINYENRVLTIAPGTSYTVTFDDTTDPAHPVLLATGVEFTDSISSPDCSDNGGGAYCMFIPSSVPYGDIKITFRDATLTEYDGVAHAFQEVNAPGLIDPDPDATCVNDLYTVPNDLAKANQNACANATFTFSGSTASAGGATQTFTTAYLPAYDTAGDLAVIAGSYSGNAGVGDALEGSSTLDVAANGTLTGTTATTDCAISGTVAVHGDKNVYDVTNLTFTDNGGSTCTLVGETFKGVATYDADGDKVTITAANDARSKGFLYVGTRVP